MGLGQAYPIRQQVCPIRQQVCRLRTCPDYRELQDLLARRLDLCQVNGRQRQSRRTPKRIRGLSGEH
jgi:hypothetical protein